MSGFRSSSRHSSTRARRWTAKKTVGCCYKPERLSASFRIRLAGYCPNLPMAADLYLQSAPLDCFHWAGRLMRCRIPAEPARDPYYSPARTNFAIRYLRGASTNRCRSRKRVHSRQRLRSPTVVDCWRVRVAAKTLRHY
jgi:hypothetical protein